MASGSTALMLILDHGFGKLAKYLCSSLVLELSRLKLAKSIGLEMNVDSTGNQTKQVEIVPMSDVPRNIK